MTRFALLSAIVALHFAAVLSINFMGGNGNGISAHLTSAKPTKADSPGLHGTRAHDSNATWWRQDDSSEATSIDPPIPIVTNYSKFDLESREIENIRDVLLKVAEKDYDEDVAYTKSLDHPAGGSKVINRYERVSHGNYTLDLDDNSLSNQEVNNIMDNKSIEITLKSPNNSLNQELETNSSINLTTRNENIERNLKNFTISENKLISSENQELHNGNDTGLNLEENDDSKNILENLNLNGSSRISHQEFELQMDFGPILNNINESIVSIETTQSTGSTQSTKFKQPIVSKKNSQSTETTESIQLTDSTGPEGSTPSIEYKEFSESIQPKESIKLEQSIKHTESEGLNTETSSINIVKIYNLTQNSETVEIDLQNNTFLPLNSSINLDIIHENNSENPSNFQEMDDVENNLEIFNDNKSLIISDELGPIMKDNITVKLMDEELNNGTNLDYIINTNETFENDTGVDDGAQRIEINEELARNSGSSITAKNYVESRRIKINDSNSLSKNRSETNLLKVVGNLRATNDDSRSKNWKEKYVHSKETTIERPEISLERKNGNWKIFNNIPVRINNLNSDDSIEDEGIDHKSLEALNERSHELYFRDEILNDVEVAGMHYSESGVANNNGEGQLIKAASVFVPDYPRGNDDVDKKVVVVTGQYEGGAKVPQPFGESATTKRAMIKRSRPSMDQSSRGNENSGKEKTASTEAAPQTTDAAVKGSKERSSTSLGVKSSTVLFVGPQDDVRTTTAIQPTRDQLPTNSNYYLTTRKDATESTTSSDKFVATECPNCTWIAAVSNTTVAAVSSTSMTSESISEEQTETIENTTSYANTSISDDERTNSSLKVPEFPWPVKREAVVEGDIVLGGLMMVHEREDSVTCGPIMPQGGIQALEAMLYTLDMLNEGSDQLLPNVTLGAHILDDCDKDTYGLEMAVDFIKG
ncbi:PREDICTED: uncharacterized protein DDB_G0286591-like [Nicrophorus vespilloides]|uniref:Uncharacterized protein DDB_G0286591-like n=1 Tax=Nicrophorus vespilloides TaxID=110193 RepID=A0ABM1M1E7_NICVS|nr:PREDICTED: uncharacterized protein DDB_G0286591-like [Nicrophorus vespilloides]